MHRRIWRVAAAGVVAVLLAAGAMAQSHKSKSGAIIATPAPEVTSGAYSCQQSFVGGPLWQMTETWSDGTIIKSTATFQADGVMVYTYNGQTYDNGRWSRVGGRFHMDTNNHFADYDGDIAGAGASGSAKNNKGHTGSWAVWRDCPG
jgi:hypothetical protein